MMAYSNSGTRLSSKFTVSVPLLASASASAWGRWETQGLVHTNCGPQFCTPSPLPGALEPEPSSSKTRDIPKQYNQCVFIRYYTMRLRVFMFPKVMKAAAGPHDLSPGDSRDRTFPELTTESPPDSDIEFDGGEDSTTVHLSSVTSRDPELEPFYNVSSVCRSSHRVPTLTSPLRRKETILT
jgi:hypothetical protein